MATKTYTNGIVTVSFAEPTVNSSGNATITAYFTNTSSNTNALNVHMSFSMTDTSPWTRIDIGTLAAGATASGSCTISTGTTAQSTCYGYLLHGSLTGVGGSFTIYAGSTTYSHKLTYDANGGSGAPSAQSKSTTTQGSFSQKISSTIPTRNDYIFLGWADSASATTVQYTAGNTYTFNAQNWTVYAVWKRKSSIVYYHGDKEIKFYYGSQEMVTNYGSNT